MYPSTKKRFYFTINSAFLGLEGAGSEYSVHGREKLNQNSDEFHTVSPATESESLVENFSDCPISRSPAPGNRSRAQTLLGRPN